MEFKRPSQKTIIFIDSNIYLRFFDSKQSSFKKLLSSVEEIYSYIFITKQIVDEVERNKLSLFQKSFAGYIDQSKLMKVELPDHISYHTDSLKEWNKERAKLEKLGTEQLQKLREVYSFICEEIFFGDDGVSSVLSLIATESQDVPIDILEKARLRKQLGNPPGKMNDPLGDQINWELLVSYVKDNNIEDLIIVSADNDYFIKIDNEPVLNNMLYVEIKNAKIDLNLFCYNTLAEGLTKFNEIRKIKNLPSSDELYKIQEEELLNSVIKKNIELFGEEMPCPNCSSRAVEWNHTFRGGIEYRDISCSNCGFYYEYAWPTNKA